MPKRLSTVVAILSAALLTSAPLHADTDLKALRDTVSPSLVAVQYTWDSEGGRRELIAQGIVVGADGLVIFPLAIANPVIPEEQMKEFKIIIPRFDTDNEELDAVFVGRDERANVAFVRLKEKRDLKVLEFADELPQIGAPVYGVGLLGKESGYTPFVTRGLTSARLRGEVPSYLVIGGLATIGSPVFNDAGKAIGYVNAQGQGVSPLLTGNVLDAKIDYFTPADLIRKAVATPPTPGAPTAMPWTGMPQLNGLKKDVAEVYKLKDTPAIEIGDVIPDSTADKAGLKRGMVITKLDGHPLERGDEPAELGGIFNRDVNLKKPGDEITLTVIPKIGEEPRDFKLTLETRPMLPSYAKRFFAEDLGFVARDITFFDTYARKLPKETKGLAIDFIKPSSAANSARLQRRDLVLQLNGQPVTDLAAFKTAYEAFRKDKPKEAVVLQVQREANTEIIRIEPPQ